MSRTTDPASAGRGTKRAGWKPVAIVVLMLAAVLAPIGPTQATHGGSEMQARRGTVDGPADAFTEGDTVVLDLEDNNVTDDAFLATDVVVETPTVQGTRLTYDVPATRWFGAPGDWTVAAINATRVHYSWNTSQGTPQPIDELRIKVDDQQPSIEGDATWTVQFCNTVSGVLTCPPLHEASDTLVFDNKAPNASIALEDARGNVASPFHKNITANITAEDGGTGVASSKYTVKRWYGSTLVPVASGTGSGNVTVDHTGAYVIQYQAFDEVGNMGLVHAPAAVVDGLAFLAPPQEVEAGTFSLMVGFVTDKDDPNSVLKSVEAPVTLTRSGATPAAIDPAGPTRDGRAVVQIQANVTGTLRFNASSPGLPSTTSPEITVTPGPVASIEVTPSAVTLTTGEEATFDALPRDRFGNPVDETVGWSATCGNVTGDGVYTAPGKAGTCTVQAIARGKVGTAEATVQEASTGTGNASGTNGSGSGTGDGAADTPAKTVPDRVVNLTSPTHPTDTWTNETRARFTWELPAHSTGVKGYDHLLAQGTKQPGASLDTEKTSVQVDIPGDGRWHFGVRPIHEDGGHGKPVSYGPILVDATPPDAPQGPSARYQRGGVNLAWEAVEDATSGVADYRIYRAASSQGAYQELATTDAPPYRDTSVDPGTIYRYRITAVDQAGNEGPASAVATAEIPGTSSGSTGDGGLPPAEMPDVDPAVYEQLYATLGLEPGSPRLVDSDGNGRADGIAGDDRIDVVTVLAVDGEEALIVRAEDDTVALFRPRSGQVDELAPVQAEVDRVVEQVTGPVAYVRFEGSSGWTIVRFEDRHPGKALIKLVADEGRVLSDGHFVREAGHVQVLVRNASSLKAFYQTRSADAGGHVLPGPSAPLIALLVALAGLAWAAKRRT